ncbi:hypothetical protein pipiens_011619, partial [Culex pipiens pipiens]
HLSRGSCLAEFDGIDYGWTRASECHLPISLKSSSTRLRVLSVRTIIQWVDDDALVERIAGDDLPVVKDGQAEGLALGVRSQVGFKPNESMAGNRRRVPGDVATSPAKGGVHGGNAIGGGLHFDEEIRFHEAGCG